MRISENQGKRVLVPVLLILSLIFRLFLAAPVSRLIGMDLGDTDWARYLIYQAVWYLVPLSVVMLLLHRPKEILSELGLSHGFTRGLGSAIVLTLPMFAGYVFLGSSPDPGAAVTIVAASVFAGFFEELFFRGFIFGQLFRTARWGFVPAAMLSGLFFASGHLYQSNDMAGAVAVFGITFIGSAWFSWLFVESGWNLWFPVFLHAFMNLSWGLFSMDDTAAGGWAANIPRFVTIALSILYILIFVRKDRGLLIRASDLWVQRKG